MATISEQKLEQLLTNYANTLDITDAQRDNAETKYNDIGDWLNSGSFFKDYAPEIYAYGSFALGTVVKPEQGEEFDLDIAVQLTKGDILRSPKEIKTAVNERLSEKSDDNPCLDADKESHPMCYTLKFPKRFSMDIVPAKYKSDAEIKKLKTQHPDKVAYLDTAIDVVNKNEQWLNSNPKGFIKWFNDISKKSKHKGNIRLMDSLEPLPANRYRSPLQQIVQILKKHALEMFSSPGLKQYKPPSIAITTLAALSYNIEYSLYNTLFNFKTNALAILGENLKLENPANPGEWFSDNWEYDETKKDYFIEWLNNIDVFIRGLLNIDENVDIKILNESFTAQRLISPYEKHISSLNLPKGYTHSEKDAEVPRTKNFQYGISVVPEIEVIHTGTKHAASARSVQTWQNFYKFNLVPFPTMHWLKFTVNTKCPAPYKMLFQVVNSPYCDEPRGDVITVEKNYNDNEPDVFYECTMYEGNHYVRCMIVKNNIIVAEKQIWVPIQNTQSHYYRYIHGQ